MADTYVWTKKASRRRVHICQDGYSPNGYIRVRCEMVGLAYPFGSTTKPWDVPDDAIPCPGCFTRGHLRRWNQVCDREMADA